MTTGQAAPSGAREESYLHGYDPVEQARLEAQGRFLESRVFAGVDYPSAARVLEIGCGVGAQTRILLERFPGTRVTGVDRSAGQIARARENLGDRASFVEASGESLPLADASFEGAFVTWVLEHVTDPLAILREARRCLVPGGVLHLNEVFNTLFHVHPPSPAVTAYWAAYNELQRELGGDPRIGARLGALLSAAGFAEIHVETRTELLDARAPEERARAVAYWTELMLSALPQLRASGKVLAGIEAEVRDEMARIAQAPDGVFFFGWVKARARRGC